MAHDLRKTANVVLHEKTAALSVAFDILSLARGVLLELYQH